jgi:hypothetical protein
VSGAGTVTLGSISIPLWVVLIALAVTRLTLNLTLKRIGDMYMQLTLNTLPSVLTAQLEMVWDIGTKVVAAEFAVS